MEETILRIPGKLVADEYGTKLANVSDLDNDVYGPYASISAAHSALSAKGMNIVGTTVGIIGANNTVTEYWYQGGTSESNLVKKKSDSIVGGDIWIKAGNSSEGIIGNENLHPDYVYGSPLQIDAIGKKLILAFQSNVITPLKMHIGGIEIPCDKTTSDGYVILSSKNNYTGTVEVSIKQ